MLTKEEAERMKRRITEVEAALWPECICPDSYRLNFVVLKNCPMHEPFCIVSRLDDEAVTNG